MKTYTINPLQFHPVNPGLDPDYELWSAQTIIGKYKIERECKEWHILDPINKVWLTVKDLKQGIERANNLFHAALERDTLSELDNDT